MAESGEKGEAKRPWLSLRFSLGLENETNFSGEEIISLSSLPQAEKWAWTVHGRCPIFYSKRWLLIKLP